MTDGSRATAIIDDLEAEEERLESILDGLDDAAWRSPSAAEGWSVADVVLHLAQSEDAVVLSAAGGVGFARRRPAAAGALGDIGHQARHAGDDAAGRALGPRPRHHRAAGGAVRRH